MFEKLKKAESADGYKKANKTSPLIFYYYKYKFDLLIILQRDILTISVSIRGSFFTLFFMRSLRVLESSGPYQTAKTGLS